MNKYSVYKIFFALILGVYTEGGSAQTYGFQLLNGTQLYLQSGTTFSLVNGLGTKVDGVNSGINNNGILAMEGAFLNQNSGLVQNGVYKIGGDFTNTSTFGSLNTTLEFVGNNPSTISSTWALNNLTVNKGTNNPIVNLAANTNINGILNFTSGFLQVNAFELSMSIGSTITGYDATKFIITNSNTSVLSQQVSSLGQFYPIGTSANSYSPLSIKQTGTKLKLSVRVTDNVQQNPTLTTGSPAMFNTGVVKKTWFVREPDPAVTKSLDITAQWNKIDELGGFDRNLCALTQWKTGTTWNVPTSPVGASSGTVPIFTRSRSGLTSVGYFAVGSSNAIIPLTLLNFTATIHDKSALLAWTTTDEQNVSHFDIEKSVDGKTFLTIAQVKANNTPSVYSSIDDDFSVSAYYRLKTNDLDRTFAFSKIIYLEKNSDKTLKIHHDTEGSIFIETYDKIEFVTITNTIGQVLKTTKDKRFLIDDLNTGIYIVSVKTDKVFLSQKVFKE
jgi:hypothetical protein